MALAYVLHRQPWRETSLLVEIWSRDHGRLGLLAKGARRPHSPSRGLLQPFQMLDLRYGQKGELRTLLAAEWRPPGATLPADRLMPAFYLNELLIRATVREQPDEDLFDAYHEAMLGLGRPESSVSGVLRWLECRLLAASGLAPWQALESEWAGLDDLAEILVSVDQGLRVAEAGQPAARPHDWPATPRLLRLLAASHLPLDEFLPLATASTQLAEGKRLLQALLAQYLDREIPLSRQVVRDLDRIRQRAARRAPPLPESTST